MQRLQRATGMLIAMFGLAFLLSVGFTMTGCKEQTTAEKVQEDMDDAADEIKDAVEDAGDEIEDATDN